ncbi:hypothetical protein TNCV_4090221 [Trichonephila clavipes]|uniref:Uncharacterized protein n=1 Tax=Trichonephila clavipes TaxID=2585209 RepID=A0A8X6VI63_TRICX|nr:hypothetical protein TNCV_4090221 [Trichonephila clavipes]
MPVFSAASDRRPLRSSTAFCIAVLKLSIPYSAKSLDFDRREQQYWDMISHNPGTLQFDLYQCPKHAGTHFCVLHDSSQQLFT